MNRNSDVKYWTAFASSSGMVVRDLPLAAFPLWDTYATDEATIAHMTDQLRRGGGLPPIVLTETFWSMPGYVEDGNHRIAAHQRAGRATIKAWVPRDHLDADLPELKS